MKLGGLEKLMARLCLKIQPSQLEKLVSCSNLTPRVKDSTHSVIKYLKSMRKTSASVEDFVSKLKQCVECLDDAHEIADLFERFHRAYPNLSVLEEEPPHITNQYIASDQQSMAFNLALLRISNELTAHHLEILVQLSPTPESQKEGLSSGVKLFEEMKRHGCVAENDTELLDDLFRVLKLTAAEGHLLRYKQGYPPRELHLSPSISPSSDVHLSFGSQRFPSPNNSSHQVKVPYTASPTQATNNLSSPTPYNSTLPSAHSTPNQRIPTTSTPISSIHSTAQHLIQGHSIPHPESNGEDSLLRTARSIPSQQPPSAPVSVNPRMFVALSPSRQASFSSQSLSGSLKRPSSEQGPSIHPRPVNETFVKPSAPPRNVVSPPGGSAAKGTMAAGKFPDNYKRLNKSPGDESAPPSSSANYAFGDTSNSLESFEGRHSHNFPSAAQRQHTGSDVKLVPGNIVSSPPANLFKEPQAPVRSHAVIKEASSHELIQSSRTVSTASSTSSVYTGVKSKEFCVTPKEQQMEISPSARSKPAFGSVRRDNQPPEVRPVIEQNSHTRAKSAQASSGTVPVSEVYYALLHGKDKPSPPKRNPLAFSRQEAARLAGAEGVSRNEPVESLGSESSSSDDESSANEEVPASPRDPHPQVSVSPVAEESPHHGKRTHEGEQEELAMPGAKRRRMVTRSSAKNKQNSSSLFRWIAKPFGSMFGLVKQETDSKPDD